MSSEGTMMDRKSLSVITRANPAWDDIACDCVAFANKLGGHLLIGIEDGEDLPPPDQEVNDELVEAIRRRIPQITVNVCIDPQIVTASNNGRYIDVHVCLSSAIAATTDGRYFIRISDETRRLMPEDVPRLANEKGAFVWETQTTQAVPRGRVDAVKRTEFLTAIRTSERVTPFVKEKSDDELLKYYFLAGGDCLTNLGVLWIGRREDRALLQHAPVVQFIKYDESGRKTNKLVWDDHEKNPKELIEAVLNEVPDWRESYELPDGLFRKQVPHFDETVIRELLANALVHRPYTTRGDIFLNLHPDRLEVHNPGLLPLGVTPANILHQTVKRNELLAKVFYDLRLMEREGSGYDLMYETLLSTGRPAPVVTEGNDRVTVTIQRRIVKREIVDLLYRADQLLALTQKERITLGIIAQHETVSVGELSAALNLPAPDATKAWLGRLVKFQVVRSKGRMKGTKYSIDPGILRTLEFKGRTTLKGIETHRLRELILRDLEIYRSSSISEIHGRIGEEIPRKHLQKQLRTMVNMGEIGVTGKKRWTRYLWTQ